MMMKRIILAIVAVFVAWSALDFLLHGLILRRTYEATAHLWRPMAEMKMGVMHVAVFIFSMAFVLIYARLVREKSIGRGLYYGLLFGLATGVSMGYGSYAVMPIPYHLAFAWFAGSLVEATVSGVIVGVIIRK